MVLVIGGRSKIGSALIDDLLERGQSVRALVRDSERGASLPAGVQSVVGDLADPAKKNEAVDPHVNDYFNLLQRFINTSTAEDRAGKLRTITKTVLEGPVLGEFTGAARFSAEGSTQLFTTLEKHVWQHGIQGYLADVLCAVHRKWELAFHLSGDHGRIEIDFPCDLLRARQLYALHKKQARKIG